ncbi:GTP-binding protein HflX [Salinibacillus kushneri]|uniref:GTPase HflX n=1 Tax=Salinibacillus kushneri TaxID=237682 RepID=A0A1I0E217_9BACI|nr:GTPase HflX [Salinibacillus kushneri]SET39004.1 GTP-binding protein HflX [Salinibacillus kushneri]
MNNKEQVLLIACHIKGTKEQRFYTSLEELKQLTETANGEVVDVIVQKRDKVHSALYIGEGKLDEIQQMLEENPVDLVILNDEVSPGQLKNLSDRLNARVIDRTQLILDIFAGRAKTREGKLQVELAQMQYLLPRLYGQGTEMSRLGAGIGTRGPGETKLETDRRHIRRRITEIKEQLGAVVNQRSQYRKRRKENQAFQIAIVGYTNAGKSTLFNRLTKSESLEENQLFATLDPLTRRVRLANGFEAIMTDTVGFIQDLPTTLVAAFRSTLEEVTEADFILHVVDGSNEDFPHHELTVYNLLEELGASRLPTLTVYNKRDQFPADFIPNSHPYITISAFDNQDLNRLLEKIEEVVKSEWKYYKLNVPIHDGRLLHRIKNHTIVETENFEPDTEDFTLTGYVDPSHPIYEHYINKEQ